MEDVAPAYEVYCACGQVFRGSRLARHQMLRCSACGQGVFVLPALPAANAVTAPVTARRWRRSVVVPVALVLVLAVGAVLTRVLWMSEPEKAARPAVSAAELGERTERGRRALGLGKFHLALRELNEAVALRDRRPDLLSPEEARGLNQLQRQADLLTRLSSRSLEEIVRQASLVRDADEWKAQFRDYRGKAVLFDDALIREANRVTLANYVVEVGDETARVALEDLTLLRELPLDEGEPATRRVLLGARLASCRREQGGEWVVRFQEDSAVLLTDEGAAAASLPGPLDAATRKVLARQREWLRKVSRVVPARE